MYKEIKRVLSCCAHADRQTDRQTDRLTDRQTDSQERPGLYGEKAETYLNQLPRRVRYEEGRMNEAQVKFRGQWRKRFSLSLPS